VDVKNDERNQEKEKIYIRDVQVIKQHGEKIVLAASWDFNSTQMAEEAGADVIVIGGGTTAMMLGGRLHALGAAMEDMLCLTMQFAFV
jgi:ketopantoate hydroxymethyltransferase